jgi:Protein of unknown function (DUF2924)
MARVLQLPEGRTLEQEIARLRDLATPEARTEWRRLTGKAVGSGLKGELLARSLAHLLQEKAHGTLSPVWQRRLATMVREAEEELARASNKVDKLPPPSGRRQIKPGSRLVREWQGALHEVVVVHDGYLWSGTVFTSLSSIAREITGTSWNGWTFFGISQPRRRMADPIRTIRLADAEVVKPKREAIHA